MMTMTQSRIDARNWAESRKCRHRRKTRKKMKKRKQPGRRRRKKTKKNFNAIMDTIYEQLSLG
jgi:hypothetical protein